MRHFSFWTFFGFFLLLVLSACQKSLPELKNASSNYLQYPTVAALVYPNGFAFCTGVFLKEDLIITAAHCIWRHTDKMSVVYNYDYPANAVLDNRLNIISGVEIYPEADLVSFPDFPANDLALILLQHPAHHIKTAELISLDYYQAQTSVHSLLTIAGYGLVDPEDKNSGGHFRTLQISVEKKYEKEIVLGNKDSKSLPCFGDSGGPAFNEHFDLVGIASRGVKYPACSAGAIYTSAVYYQDWIEVAYKKMLLDREKGFVYQDNVELSREPSSENLQNITINIQQLVDSVLVLLCIGVSGIILLYFSGKHNDKPKN